jgi:NADH-quinone oxidoreductase subunit L
MPPFSGFFSKDSIISAAMQHGWYGWLLWIAALAGTLLTGIYTFRMLFVVFGGEQSPFVREHFHALRRDVPGLALVVPVGILAVLALAGGWLQFAPLWHPLTDWLERGGVVPLVDPTSWDEGISSALAFALGLSGIGVAWLLYGARRVAVPRAPALQALLEHKFYFDELYDYAFYRPAVLLAVMLRRLVEEPFITGSVVELADTTRGVARRTSRLETGILRLYALAIAAGVAVLALVFIAAK